MTESSWWNSGKTLCSGDSHFSKKHSPLSPSKQCFKLAANDCYSLDELPTSIVAKFLYNSSKVIYSHDKWDSPDPPKNEGIWHALNITSIKGRKQNDWLFQSYPEKELNSLSTYYVSIILFSSMSIFAILTTEALFFPLCKRAVKFR